MARGPYITDVTLFFPTETQPQPARGHLFVPKLVERSSMTVFGHSQNGAIDPDRTLVPSVHRLCARTKAQWAPCLFALTGIEVRLTPYRTRSARRSSALSRR